MITSSPAQETYQKFVQALSSSSDFTMKTMRFANAEYRLFYLDTMVDSSVLQDHIIKPLSQNQDANVQEVVTVQEMLPAKDFQEALHAIVQGKTVLQKEGERMLWLLGTELQKDRSVNISTIERVLRGSKEAFIEDLDTNINLVRRRSASSDVVVKHFTLGKLSRTRIAIIYLQGVANPDVIRIIEQRLQRIDVDYVYAPGFIQEYVQDKPFSLFPQILTTERPDRTKAYLLEGKVAIITDGSPEATIMPVSFWSFLQSPDDYQINWLIGSTFRLLRAICFLTAIGLPGLYISLASFQTYILPMNLALTLQGALKYITFPPVMEIILMLIALEILREATVRLPSPIGQAIGVVGGIVVGTAVVQSNVLSNTAVIVASFTGLASFILPSYEMSSSVRLISIPVILLSALLGLVGLTASFLFVIIYLCRMNTMGLPYFYPIFADGAIKDTLLRAPFWLMRQRPREAAPRDKQRNRNSKG